MVEIELSRLSSKGQIVIPSIMRKGFKKGEKILLIKNKDSIILKKATVKDEQFREDLEFARRTKEARKRIEAGEGTTMDFDDLIEEMKKW